MKHFENKVAVITGGASGLGEAMAYRFAQQGMKIVLADIEKLSLQKTVNDFKDKNYDVLGVPCDVSKSDEVDNLAKLTKDHFGNIHILCNNAGVSVTGRVWEHTPAEWEWAMGVNIWGVINGIRSFVPSMLEQNSEGHIINTASVAGLLSLPQMRLYCLTKHSVVTLSESLYHDLKEIGAKVSCSVLCPAYVPTKISQSERNRPQHLRDSRLKTEENLIMEQDLKYAVESGKLSAEDIAQLVFEATYNDQFYILSHPNIKKTIEKRMGDILNNSQPTNTFKKRQHGA